MRLKTFRQLVKQQHPDELPIVVQIGDVVVIAGHFYRVDEHTVTELTIVPAPEVR